MSDRNTVRRVPRTARADARPIVTHVHVRRRMPADRTFPRTVSRLIFDRVLLRHSAQTRTSLGRKSEIQLQNTGAESGDRFLYPGQNHRAQGESHLRWPSSYRAWCPEGEANLARRWRLDEDIASGARNNPRRICRALANFIPSTAQTFQCLPLNARSSWPSEAP